MSLRKHGLKVLGLGLLAAVGLMAFSATAAQAVWLESGATITGLKNATGEVDLLGVFDVPERNVEIDCAAFKVKKGEILGNGHANGSNIAHVELLYESCTVNGISPLTADTPCEVYETQVDRENSTNPGNLLAKGLATIIDMGGTKYVEVEGTLEAEEVFARIWSRNCLALPNGTKVKGLVTLDLHEGSTTNRVKQLVQVANLTLFPNKLKYGINPALLLGAVWVKLESGNPWGVC
jgi:hypothetical protein